MREWGPSILVIDDELGMREGCRKTLADEGYEVQTAEDGLAGLELFKRPGDFAVVLVDLKMPRMGGLEVVEKLRVLDQDVVLLVITAYATIDTAVEATKRGAYGYIPKPFTPDELLLAVRNGIERRALSLETRQLREEREKRLLEVAFERSKCNTVINCMTDGVVVVNRDRQIVLRNAAAARIIPECVALALPAPLSSLPCPEFRAIVSQALRESSAPVIVSKELLVGKSTYMVNASPVFEPNGEMLGAVALLRDITPLKKLEVAKSTFVSMVAHEVKNPIAAIEGYLTLILSGASGSNAERDRAMMQRAVVRAQTLRCLVSELLNLTAIETGNFTIKRSPQDLRTIVARAVESYKEKAESKRITLALYQDGKGPCESVLADEASMLSVFTNLVDNAIKYTPDGGHVDVVVQHNEMYVKVTVRDDGIGMTSNEADCAFDEFFRAKNAYTAHVPGTGLGLSLAKRLVEMHHGTISVEAAPGLGSIFTVSVPIAAVAGESP
ncbi:MAG TPA: response regulator [Thermoguttaceae bacterium]|nr:response regulator [Thermoguttaceae bacterium]